MSKVHEEKIVCPKCGKESSFYVYDSLNGTLDPEAKKQLMDGSLFTFRCEACGNESTVDYGLLYHDMTHQVMIYYAQPEEVERLSRSIDEAQTVLPVDMSSYRNRIVTNHNSLREKAMLFDNGLDDRVAEVIKVMYFAHARQQFPDAEISEIFLWAKDGTLQLEMIGKTSLCAEVPMETYASVQQTYGEKLEKMGDTARIVDIAWVGNLLQS